MSKPLATRAGVSLAALGVIVSLASSARAELASLDEPSGLGVGVFAKGSALRFEDVSGRTVAIGDATSANVNGETSALGAGLSLFGWTARLRYGLDLSAVFGVHPGQGVTIDASTVADPHPRGRSVFVATLQPFAGIWLGAGRVRPYLDASARYEIVSFGEGGPGAAAFDAGRLSLVPRIGLASQLTRHLGTDVSIGGAFFGFTRVEVRAGIFF